MAHISIVQPVLATREGGVAEEAPSQPALRLLRGHEGRHHAGNEEAQRVFRNKAEPGHT